jgi:hypothetical protein
MLNRANSWKIYINIRRKIRSPRRSVRLCDKNDPAMEMPDLPCRLTGRIALGNPLWLLSSFQSNKIRTGIPWRHNNAITRRDVARPNKNDVTSKHGATTRHRSCVIYCYVMSRNFGLTSVRLDTVHTIQIESDSGPYKYFEVFYYKNTFYNKTAYFAGFCGTSIW